MLRIERIFEPEGIAEELGAYNPLIPDGRNWKATLLIEFPDAEERTRQLAKLRGIEDRCWVQVHGHDRVFAIADEDLERENDEKTSVGALPALRAAAGDDSRRSPPALRSSPAWIIDALSARHRPSRRSRSRRSLADLS